MSHEASAQEILDRLDQIPAVFSFGEALQAAQVHATLAVADAVDRLVRVLRERDRP